MAWLAVFIASCRLAAVHLVDAHLCSDPTKYISALLLSLSTMLHLELPHVNLLSKIDLIQQYGKLHFNLDFYTEVTSHAESLPVWLLSAHNYINWEDWKVMASSGTLVLSKLGMPYLCLRLKVAQCETGARLVVPRASHGQ